MVAVEQDRIDYCFPGIEHVPQRLAERYGINRPGGQFFVSPSLWITFVAFNHDRPAFRGPGRSRSRRRSTTQSTDRRWPASSATWGAKRTDQLLPPALARPASIYPLKGADPATARKWLARATIKPTTLVLYSHNTPQVSQSPRHSVYNLKQIRIDVQVKYFFPMRSRPGSPRAGSPSTSP